MSHRSLLCISLAALTFCLASEVIGQDKDTFLQRGHALKHEGKLDEALSSYRKALELDPNFNAAKLSVQSAEQAKEVERFHANAP